MSRNAKVNTVSQKECFFLHAKAHSSGLNLVNATHVFLCEPLINTAIELQYVFFRVYDVSFGPNP